MANLGNASATVLCVLLMLCHFSLSQSGGKPHGPYASAYRIIKHITLPGSEPGGHLFLDSVSRRAYFARKTHISIFDIDSGHMIADIAGLPGVHDLTVVPDLNRGFAPTDSGTLIIFDLKNFHKIRAVPIGNAYSNNMAYDPAGRRVFLLNRAQSLMAFNAADGALVGTLDLVDNAESAVADGKGFLYVVLADPAELAVVDTRKLSLVKRIQLAPCIEPRGSAMDADAHRVFVGCSNKFLLVVDADRAAVITRLTVGRNAGDIAFDDEAQLVFTLNTAGTVSIVRKDFPDKYHLIGTVSTNLGASTMAIDVTTHRLFVAPIEGLPSRQPQPRNVIIAVLGR